MSSAVEKIRELAAPEAVNKWAHDFIYGHDLSEVVDDDEILDASREFAVEHWSEYKKFIKKIRAVLREYNETMFDYLLEFRGCESHWYYKSPCREGLDCEELVFWRYLYEKCYDVFEKEGVPLEDSSEKGEDTNPVPKKKARTDDGEHKDD